MPCYAPADALPTSTSLGLSTQDLATTHESSSFTATLCAMEAQPSNGYGAGGSDAGGSAARGRTVARAGPAPVLTDASIRRRREHSRQASVDMAAKENIAAFHTLKDNGFAYERTASYMAQTQSSLRHASLGSEASITGSVRRLRRRVSADRDDDASDVASVASSQWSVRRRRVGPRAMRPVERPVPTATTTSERAQRIAARTAAQRAAEVSGTADSGAADADGVRLQANPVVVRGGAWVSPSRKSSIDVSDGASPNPQAPPPAAQALNGFVSGAPSASLTNVTVSDEDTGELTKSGVSVSLSPVTSGARSARRSQLQSRHGSGSASGGGGGGLSGRSKGAAEFLSCADGDGVGDDIDVQRDPMPRATQPMSFDGYASLTRVAGPPRSIVAAEKAGRPPLTPRGDASPHLSGHGGGRRNSSLGGAQAIPATRLTSNTVHRHSSSFDAQQQQRLTQRRSSIGESANGATRNSTGPANAATATHRVTDDRRSGGDLDGAVRKSTGEDSMDDTPISVLKERADREAQQNARRDSDQPVVPRLALGDITAKRETQRRSTSYTVANAKSHAYAPDTPMTGGSVLSDVTVSSMTGSATPCVMSGGPRSGRAHTSGHRPSHVEDVRVDPSPVASAMQAQKADDRLHHTGTYDSHGASPAREDSTNVATKISPSRHAAVADATTASAKPRDKAEGGAPAVAAPAAPTSRNATAMSSTNKNNNADHRNTTTAGTKNKKMNSTGPDERKSTADAAAKPRGEQMSNSVNGTGESRQASPEPKAPAAAAATAASTKPASGQATSATNATGKKQRAFEKNNAATTSAKASPLPANASKDNAKCCVVM